MARRNLTTSVIALLALTPLVVEQSAASEENLKLTHQMLVSAITSGNPGMAEPVLHSNAIGFFRDSQVIVQLGSTYGAREALPAVLAETWGASRWPHTKVCIP